MIKLSDVTLRRGPNVLFASATLMIHPGQRVGLTGANGTGKTSLLALLQEQLHADIGSVSIPQNWVFAHVAQEMPATDTTALDYVLAGDGELTELNRQLLEAEQSGDGHVIADLHEKLTVIDGYTAPSRAARLLHGLGFQNGQESWPVKHFSGGWRMRLNLAQALMCRSDLLLLDEPTNHLDLEAVYWLEEWLRSYPGTLVVISHDRDFLDRVVTHVAHIEHQQIKLYTGNYSYFEQLRAEHLANQQSQHEKQQREIAHMRQFVTRFRAQANKARQAQSRIKALERMEKIAPAHVDSPFHFQFLQPRRLGTPLISLHKAAVGYGATPLIENIELTLSPGDRIGLLGPNGAGKSTLIKLLAGELPLLAGKRTESKDLQIGYFAQHQLEQLRGEDSPLTHLMRMDKQATEQELRDYLGGFGFHGDKALEKVAPFSGGEKARLVLAILVYQRPALLLLDEPTNHLDLEMRLALTVALQSFEGAMLVVSHDRHLLRSATDSLWLVSDGQAREFDGDLEDYRRWRMDQDKASLQDNSATGGNNKKRERQQAAQRREQLQPLQKQIKKTENRLSKLEQQMAELEAALADPEIYAEAAKDRLKTVLSQQADARQALDEAEAEWLELNEQLEAARQAAGE